MRQLATALTAIILTSFTLSARESSVENVLSDSIDNRQEILEQLENLPNIEVGKGITFRPKNDSYEMTMRFRMQNMIGLHFNDRFALSETDLCPHSADLRSLPKAKA